MIVVTVICEGGLPYQYEDAEADRTSCAPDLKVVHKPTGETLAYFVSGYWKGFVTQSIVDEQPQEPDEKKVRAEIQTIDTAAA